MSEFLLPDFVGIGGHRCGSSWLWKNMRRHPKIWTPSSKELHFFDRKLQHKSAITRNYASGARMYYRRFFAKSAAGLGLVRGEFTPAYSTLNNQDVAFIKQVIPESRFLFIMRDPIERAWSHLRKDIPDALAVSDSAEREKAIKLFLDSESFKSRMDYARTLEIWFRHFKNDQFLLLFFETAVEAPLSTLKSVWRFVGVDPDDAVVDLNEISEKVNSRSYQNMDRWLEDYLRTEYQPMVDRLRTKFGLAPPWQDL
jgi:hypothetical protein